MKKEDKVKISKEVFEMIVNKMQLMGLTPDIKVWKFGFDLFLEGVKFIPNKTTTDSKKNTESG